MSSIDQDDDERDEFAEELADLTSDRIANAVDRIADAICRIALSPKAIPSAQKKLDRLERKQAAIAKENAEHEAAFDEREAELAQRAAALDERERVLDARAAEFETSLAEAHATLRASHDNLSDADRRLRYRILNHAGLLGGYNPQLQDLPTWDQLKRLVVGLPDDLPAAPPAEVVSENVREDWTGNVFVPGSTLTRSTEHKRA